MKLSRFGSEIFIFLIEYHRWPDANSSLLDDFLPRSGEHKPHAE